MTTPTIIQTIEDTLSKDAAWVAHEATEIAHEVWGVVWDVWNKLQPEAWTTLINIVDQVIRDVEDHDFDLIIQDVVMRAEVLGHDFIVTLEAEFLKTTIASRLRAFLGQ